MKKTIYKYTFQGPEAIFDIAEDAEILTIQLQNNSVQLWALVDIDKPTTKRSFLGIATGLHLETILESNEEIKQYIATVQLDNGLVFHFFETKNKNI